MPANGEEARQPVSMAMAIMSSRCGRKPTDETRETGFRSSLRSGINALKGGKAPRESLFAAGGNATNPRVGSRVQHLGAADEE